MGGCINPGIEEGTDNKIKLSATSVVTSSNGERKTILIECNAAWHIEGHVDWCECSIKEGAGRTEVSFETRKNETYDERRVTYHIVSGKEKVSFTVVQKQLDALIVTTNKIEVSPDGETFSVEVKSNIDFVYDISYETPETQRWIFPEDIAKTRALKQNTLYFKALPSEETTARRATITISSRGKKEDINIYQAGNHILLLSKNEYVVSEDGGTITIELRSNIDYEVEQPKDDWIEPVSTRSVSTHTLRYLIHPNDTYDSRSTKIVFSDADGNAPTQTVTVTQLQRGATILLAQERYVINQEGGEFTAEIASNVDFEVKSSYDWVTFEKLPSSRGLVNSRYRFVVEENTSQKDRSAVIEVLDGISRQYIEVNQRGMPIEAYQIRYTTTDGLPIDYNNPRVVTSNTYENGQGVITFIEQVIDVYGFGDPYGNSYRTLKTIEIPEGAKKISFYAFGYCTGLERISIPASVEFIDRWAFCQCISLKEVDLAPGSKLAEIGEGAFLVCKSLEHFSIPDGVTELNATFGACYALRSVQIGENSCIKRITGDAFESCYSLTSLHLPFKEMIEIDERIVHSSPTTVYVPENLVESYRTAFPYWAVLSEKYLDNKYISTDYSRDGEIVTLQTHTRGGGVGLVLMGDGYADFHHQDGSYDKVMQVAAEAFFAKEPYKSLRSYFDVYFIRMVSPNETIAEGNVSLSDRRKKNSKAFELARRIPGLDLTKSAVAVIENVGMTDANAVGICFQYLDNSSVSYLSTGNYSGWTMLIRHETGGHGLGKLDDEFSHKYDRIDANGVADLKHSHTLGWSENIDVTDNPASVIWADFLNEPLYASSVGIYEGGGYYAHGVYRPTEYSVMGDADGIERGYNAPSRYSIYKKVMDMAGEEHSWESFVEFDAPAREQVASQLRTLSVDSELSDPVVKTGRPQFINKRWYEAD